MRTTAKNKSAKNNQMTTLGNNNWIYTYCLQQIYAHSWINWRTSKVFLGPYNNRKIMKKKCQLSSGRNEKKFLSFVALPSFARFQCHEKNKFWSHISLSFSFCGFLLLHRNVLLTFFTKWTCHKHIFCRFGCHWSW